MNAIRALALVAIVAILLTPSFSAPARAEGELDAFGSISFVNVYKPNPVAPGGTTLAYYQIKNSSIFPLVEMAFSDELTDRFEFVKGEVKSNCSANLSFPNHYTIKLTSGILGPGKSCTITVPVKVPSFLATLFTTDLQLTAKGLAPISAPPTALRIEKLDQTIDFGPIAETLMVAASVVPLTASASSGLPVTFEAEGACALQGEASLKLTHGDATCKVTATQAGDAQYNPAPPESYSFAVAKVDQEISFAKLPDRTVGDGPFNVAAKSTLKLPSIELPISFSAKGECSVKGNVVTLSGQPGTCTITAKQPGNEVVNPAKSVSRTFAISSPAKQSQSIAFAALPDRTVGDGPFQLSASASSSLPVSYSAEGACSVSGGIVTLSGQPGACTISASQPGDAQYNPASPVAQSFTIAAADEPGPAPQPEPAPAPYTVYLPLLSK